MCARNQFHFIDYPCPVCLLGKVYGDVSPIRYNTGYRSYTAMVHGPPFVRGNRYSWLHTNFVAYLDTGTWKM